jgi:hypothetical protein
MYNAKTQGSPKYFNPIQTMRIERDCENSKELLPEWANATNKGYA